MLKLVLVKFCLKTIFTIEAARILAVFPTPSISHQVVFRPLTQELARRGHEVVVITADPAFPKEQTPANLTEIDVHDISYKIWREKIILMASGQKNDIYMQAHSFLNIILEIPKQQILYDEVQNLIKYKSRYFDLLLIEACMKTALAFSHAFKAPVILISSFGATPGNYELVGAPTNPPLLYGSTIHQRLYSLTLWEKLSELYSYCYIKYLIWNHDEKLNEMIKEVLGPDTPTLQELSDNVEMIFFNTYTIWEDNRPVPPSVIYIGGLHQNPIKELPLDLKSYLDSSVNGVIYISFGTNVRPSMLPPEKIQAMVRVLSQLPYDVLWKWDKDVLPGGSTNIRISKWLPQSDLLRHPKVKLFITQGGLQSTDEAITAGVPLIGIPMLGDQWYNVEKYSHHKIGLKCDMETLTEESFAEAINNIIENESYRRNVAKLRALMLDQPQRPLERAVWWTEHVLRHGGARHLRAPAANMSWSEYLDLELLSILLVSWLFITAILFYAIYLLINFIQSKTKVKSKRA